MGSSRVIGPYKMNRPGLKSLTSPSRQRGFCRRERSLLTLTPEGSSSAARCSPPATAGANVGVHSPLQGSLLRRSGVCRTSYPRHALSAHRPRRKLRQKIRVGIRTCTANHPCMTAAASRRLSPGAAQTVRAKAGSVIYSSFNSTSRLLFILFAFFYG